MAKLITANMRLELDQPTTSLTTLWRIVRVDEEVFYFTEHDVDVPYDGNVYSSDAGYSRSAISNDSSLSVDSLDVEGVFDSAGITKTDLRAGLFDFAEVYVSLVNWKDPDGDGDVKLRRGWFGEVEITQQGTFRVELRGMAQALSQKIVKHYQAECQTDLGSPLCKVPIDPSTIRRSEELLIEEDGGDVYRKVATTGATGAGALTNIVNGGFETGDLTGWTQTSSVWGVSGTANSGSWSADPISGGAASLDQIVDLRVSGGGDVPDASLATGLVEVSVSCYINAHSNSGWGGGLRVEFLDSSDAFISTLGDTGETNGGGWLQHILTGVAPSNTAKIKIYLDCEVIEASLWDDVAGTYFDGSVDIPQANYENKIYKVVTAGVTADTQPVYDETVGNTTTDGTAVLEAVDAWMRDAVIASVTSDKLFTLTVSESRDVDDWFKFGGLTWVTGSNAGRTSEIKEWTQTGALVELYLTMPREVQVGDELTLYPGCNKAWSPGDCVDKFNNGINHRGHPFIVGQDEAAKIPDSRTGGAGGGITGGGGFGRDGYETNQF